MVRAVVPAHDVDVILARPTATSVTLSVLASTDTEATLTWEPVGGTRRLSMKAGIPLEVEIGGLSPGQSHRYTISGPGRAAVAGSFRTAPVAGTPFRFVVQADSHLDGNTDTLVYENTLSNMAADGADFVVDLGDTFMTDKFPRFEDAASQYLAQRYYLGRVGRIMPVFLALGNHDGEAGWMTRDRGAMTEWARATRLRFFPSPQASAFYKAGPPNSAYYAWNWGDALFLVLDPFMQTRTRPGPGGDGWAWTLGRDQYDWLDRTLAESKARHRFVFIHHLVGGSAQQRAQEARGGAEASRFFEWGGAGADGSAAFAVHRSGWRMPIHDLLRSHGVSAVFHGHDHLYARQERDGIAYLETPQPGHPGEGLNRAAAAYGYESGTLLGGSGHLRVSVTPESATVEYVRSRLDPPGAEIADRHVLKPGRGTR